MESRLKLSERLKTRAASVQPDKAVPTVLKIIEARGAIAEQRLRGMSWNALSRLLAEEGVNLSENTLRNYVRLIGKAEAYLLAKENREPTDAEIHAVLYIRSETPTAQPQTRTVPQKALPSALALHREQQGTHPSPQMPPQAARSSVIRNPDREL